MTLPEEVREEDDLLTGEELKLFQSVAARFNFLAMDRPDILYSVKELTRKMASPRTQDLTALKRVARYTITYPRMACRCPWTQLDNNIEVFGDANFAGCHSTRKSTVGGVAMWSGQVVKAWSKTMGVLALSSGASELAAVVRTAMRVVVRVVCGVWWIVLWLLCVALCVVVCCCVVCCCVCCVWCGGGVWWCGGGVVVWWWWCVVVVVVVSGASY